MRTYRNRIRLKKATLASIQQIIETLLLPPEKSGLDSTERELCINQLGLREHELLSGVLSAQRVGNTACDLSLQLLIVRLLSWNKKETIWKRRTSSKTSMNTGQHWKFSYSTIGHKNSRRRITSYATIGYVSEERRPHLHHPLNHKFLSSAIIALPLRQRLRTQHPRSPSLNPRKIALLLQCWPILSRHPTVLRLLRPAIIAPFLQNLKSFAHIHTSLAPLSSRLALSQQSPSTQPVQTTQSSTPSSPPSGPSEEGVSQQMQIPPTPLPTRVNLSLMMASA